MKTYEKLYKEALERARVWKEKSGMPKNKQGILDDIFPELKESEDERILEIIKHCIESRYLHTSTIKGISQKQCFAWLEKQGEQKSVDKEYTFKAIPRLLDMMEPTEKAKAYCQKLIDTLKKEGYHTDAKIVGECLRGMNGENVAMAVMDEQPITKVEPKFRVGDWILYSGDHYEGVRHITKINENGYYIERNGLPHGIIPFNHEICMRLWTIDDAKDGDVLYSKKHNLLWIYKDAEQYYSCINLNYSSNISIGGDIVIPNDTCPATKEQRDLLFRKMHEAGYGWDAEKKELKLLITNGGDFGVQNNEWSEEDYINWLKKQGYFKWGDEDNENMNSLCVLLDQMVSINAIGNEHSIEYKNWLKSIKQRIGE